MDRSNGRLLLLPLSFTLILFTFCARVDAQDSQAFRTRPEIQIPTWDITVHDQQRLSPGYWFLAPYGDDGSSPEDGSGLTTPMIFDQSGELIWSGAALTEGFRAFDFQVSNVLGEDMLTFTYPRNHSMVMLDKHFNVFKQLEMSPFDSHETYNGNELNVVSGGTRALFFYDLPKKAGKTQSAKIGAEDCLILESTFREIDMLDEWRFVYRWSASKRIDLRESVATEGTVEERCDHSGDGWDWLQANSVDKFDHEGDYLLSARKTNTIYKILRDGDIAWRLGGDRSDFQADFTFSGQSHARIQSYNDTHTVISFMDNGDAAPATSETSGGTSRGLLVSLRTDTAPKTATALAEYTHPRGPGVRLPDGGSMQVMPDGHVFSGWLEGLLISEHDADGQLLMSASVDRQWLKSYRSYKGPFVGQPSQPPDVHAEYSAGGTAGMTVYASWNGATEVAGWNVHSSANGSEFNQRDFLAFAERSGFETSIEIEGQPSYIVVEAVDEDGGLLGVSRVFAVGGSEEALAPGYVPTSGNDEEEEEFHDGTQTSGHDTSWKDQATSRSGLGGFLGGVGVLIGLVFGLRFWRRRGQQSSWVAKHNRKPSDHEMLSRSAEAYAIEDGEDDEEDHDFDRHPK